ncbi:hypothetical protein ACTFIU_004528 [Dictyostelium citrinum]
MTTKLLFNLLKNEHSFFQFYLLYVNCINSNYLYSVTSNNDPSNGQTITLFDPIAQSIIFNETFTDFTIKELLVLTLKITSLAGYRLNPTQNLMYLYHIEGLSLGNVVSIFSDPTNIVYVVTVED